MSTSVYYPGSRLLEPFADKIKVPVDQLNFILCQFLSLFYAIWFRSRCHPTKVSSEVTRHYYLWIPGFLIALFCHGHHLLYVLFQICICYVATVKLKSNFMPYFVFVTGMGTLVFVHLYRQYYGLYGLYTVDISGMLMMTSQKVTIVAFGLYDGTMKDKQNAATKSQTNNTQQPNNNKQHNNVRTNTRITISRERRDNMYTEPPTLLEYFSYLFYFQSILAGPVAFYLDYKHFVTHGICTSKKCSKFIDYKVFDNDKDNEEKNLNRRKNHLTNGDSKEPGLFHRDTVTSEEFSASTITKPPTSSDKIIIAEPSPNKAVVQKLIVSLITLISVATILPKYPLSLTCDEGFIESFTYPQRAMYLLAGVYVAKCKFYHIWTLADSISNASGFGFNGFTDNGATSMWNRMTNIDIYGIEFATSIKLFTDSWNIQTNKWLRYVCYDRMPFHPMPFTFLLSSIWHGFYPGYFIVFIPGIAVIFFMRRFRRIFRPHILRGGSPVVKMAYDILTWACTQWMIAYIIVPFPVLHLSKALIYYRSHYWWTHIFIAVGHVVLTIVEPHFFIPSSVKKKLSSEKVVNDKQYCDDNNDKMRESKKTD